VSLQEVGGCIAYTQKYAHSTTVPELIFANCQHIKRFQLRQVVQGTLLW